MMLSVHKAQGSCLVGAPTLLVNWDSLTEGLVILFHCSYQGRSVGVHMLVVILAGICSN